MKNTKLSDSLISDPRFLSFLIGWLQKCDESRYIQNTPAVELERAAESYCEYNGEIGDFAKTMGGLSQCNS